MKPASLFPALEKACPKHRNLMNRLYHKIDAPSPLQRELVALEEDDIDRIAAALDECWPLGDRRAERLFRLRYDTIIDHFWSMLLPSHLLRIIREPKNLHYLNLNLTGRRHVDLQLFWEVPRLNTTVIFENTDQCVAIINSDDRYTTLLFDDDTAAVRAKLQLCDFLFDDVPLGF